MYIVRCNIRSCLHQVSKMFMYSWASPGHFCKFSQFCNHRNRNIYDFCAPTANNEKKTIAIYRRFRLNLGTCDASANGASEKFRVFYRGTAYDVIIFKFRGRGTRPLPPLLMPICIHKCKPITSLQRMYNVLRCFGSGFCYTYDGSGEDQVWGNA